MGYIAFWLQLVLNAYTRCMNWVYLNWCINTPFWPVNYLNTLLQTEWCYSVISLVLLERTFAGFIAWGLAGCGITGFLAFRDTQKHCWKAIFLTWISNWKPYKNQGFGKPNLTQGFPSIVGKPDWAAESQFLEVAFRKET